jgi:hypothetical protein
VTAAWPTDEEVVQNAKAAYSEVRAQIDHQIRNADAIDTKATAVITAVGVLAALVAPRFHLDAAIRQGSGAFALLIGFVALGCCFLAIRPQADFAFGADPADLTELGGKEEAALCARTDDGYRRVLVAADIALLASSRRLGPAIPSRHLRLLADALLRLRGSASGGTPSYASRGS